MRRVLVLFLIVVCLARAHGQDTPQDDPTYSQLRNRVGLPEHVSKVHIADILALPQRFPERTVRSNWWPSDLTKVNAIEGHGVVIYGYVTGVTIRPQESSNAQGQFTLEFHVMEATRGTDIVCQLNPAFLTAHSEVKRDQLTELAKTGAYFRITGWLLWESMDDIDPTVRVTPWEISPVVRMEYFSNGIWKQL